MELFTKELVSIVAALLFPDNKLSSFTNVFSEQLELQFRKSLIHQCPNLSQSGSWCFLIVNFESCRSFIVWNAVSTLAWWLLLLLFYKLFTTATESGRSMGGCKLRNILPINVAKCHGGKIHVFPQNLPKSSEFYYLEPGLYPSFTDMVEAKNNLIQERHNHSKSCIRVKLPQRTQNVEIFLANEETGLVFFNTYLRHFFGSKVGNDFAVILRVKGPHKPEFAYDIVRIHPVSWYTRTWLSTKSLATRKLPCCVACLSFESSKLETL